MCDFISWIEHDGKIYFLQDHDLKGKTFNAFKRENGGWRRDIVGHGAIRFFYPELGERTGVNKECEDFSKASNFPVEIQSAIRGMRMTKFGVYPDGLLNKRAYKAYKEAIAPADKAWQEAIAPADKAWVEARVTAYKAYEEAIAPAYKANKEARATAYKAREEAIATAFWGLFWDEKNRAKAWRTKIGR